MARRLLRFSLVGIILVLMLAVYVPVQQRLLRHRAERLLSSIRTLELRKSNWEDAQRLIHHWGSWGDDKGRCTSGGCLYTIELTDRLLNTARSHPKLFKLWSWLYRPYSFLGGRPTRVIASFTVKDGIIWRKSYELIVTVPPEKGPDAPFGGYGYDLIGRARTVSNFYPRQTPQVLLHPEYQVWSPGGCKICKAVVAEYTPYAAHSDIQRLMNFNLSCITSREPCREKNEILPAAWAHLESEAESIDKAWHRVLACDYPLQVRGRDSRHAVVAEIVSNRREQSGRRAYQR